MPQTRYTVYVDADQELAIEAYMDENDLGESEFFRTAADHLLAEELEG